MQKLIVKILIFLSPALLLLIAAELMLRNIPNDYRVKHNTLEVLSPSLQILVLGSSHSYYNINPDYFSMNGYNAGHSSQTLKYDWLLFNKYSSKTDSLKYLLIPVSYFSFYESMEDDVEAWRTKNYYLYYGIQNEIPVRFRFEITSFPVRVNFSRLYDYYIRHRNPVYVNAKGYATDFIPDNKIDIHKKGVESALRNTKKDTSHIKENLEYIEQIIRLAELRKVKLILFTSPAYSSYTLNLNAGQQLKTNNLINSLLQKYPNLVYRDYQADKDFKRDDFYDADHLNTIGAKKFTLKLDKLIDSLNNK